MCIYYLNMYISASHTPAQKMIGFISLINKKKEGNLKISLICQR